MTSTDNYRLQEIASLCPQWRENVRSDRFPPERLPGKGLAPLARAPGNTARHGTVGQRNPAALITGRGTPTHTLPC